MSIGLTQRAAQEIRKILLEAEMPESACFRIGIKGMSDQGIKYHLEIADSVYNDDIWFSEHGVIIACDMASYVYLKGTTVDFNETEGFEMNNPNIVKEEDKIRIGDLEFKES